MYIPKFLKDIQSDLNAAQDKIQSALDIIEKSTEYNDILHPFHNSAVADYNALVTIAIKLHNMEV